MDEPEEDHLLQDEMDVSGEESLSETDHEEMDLSFDEENPSEAGEEEINISHEDEEEDDDNGIIQDGNLEEEDDIDRERVENIEADLPLQEEEQERNAMNVGAQRPLSGEESLSETDNEEMDVSSDESEENPSEAGEEEMNISHEEEDDDDDGIFQDENLEEVEDIYRERVENVQADLPLQEERQVRNAIDVGVQGPLFEGFLDNQRMNIYLQGRHDRTAKDHLLVAIAHNVAERETYKSLIGNLRWTKKCYINCNIPTTMKQLWKVLGRDKSNLTYSVYCSLCQRKVGDGQRATRFCYCGSCGPGLNKKHLATYILVPIIPQLKDILKLPHMAQSLRYRDERVKINPENLEDIYDGQKYVDERRNGFLRDERNLSLTLWVDGVALTKSSNASCCPILLHINELPPYARIKHTILAGVYVGNKKPNISSLLLPVAEQLQYLHFTGIPWRPDNGPEIISKFILLIFTADSVARPEVLRMMQYNSYFACPKCFIRGLWMNSKIVYPHAPRVLRSDQDFRNDMEEAVLRGQVVRGMKGSSVLSHISRFDLEAGVVHDDLHNYDLGCTKQLTTMHLTNTNTAWYIGDEANLSRIDEKLALIKVPTELSRRPRSIRMYKQWKGSEWRNWLLYYSLPCLDGILKEPYFSHLALLCGAVFILSNSSISQADLTVAQAYLIQFCALAQRHYELENMSFNFHFSGHAPESTAHWGPMWVYSTYAFETFCSKIKDTVTSATSRADQIVNRFLLKKYVEQSIHNENVSEATKAEVKLLLNYKPVNVPQGMQQGHYFIGIGTGRTRRPIRFEINHIREMGEEIEEETIITVYTKASIHGVEYRKIDGVERDYFNSVVYTKRGFFLITGLISYQIEERTVAGILGECLEQRNNLYGTRYIKEIVRNNRTRFVSFHDVIVPGLFFSMNNKSIIIPLSNATSID